MATVRAGVESVLSNNGSTPPEMKSRRREFLVHVVAGFELRSHLTAAAPPKGTIEVVAFDAFTVFNPQPVFPSPERDGYGLPTIEGCAEIDTFSDNVRYQALVSSSATKEPTEIGMGCRMRGNENFNRDRGWNSASANSNARRSIRLRCLYSRFEPRTRHARNRLAARQRPYQQTAGTAS